MHQFCRRSSLVPWKIPSLWWVKATWNASGRVVTRWLRGMKDYPEVQIPRITHQFEYILVIIALISGICQSNNDPLQRDSSYGSRGRWSRLCFFCPWSSSSHLNRGNEDTSCNLNERGGESDILGLNLLCKVCRTDSHCVFTRILYRLHLI